jgi:hypothetical protein
MNERIKELAEEAGFRYIKDEGIGWAGNHNASLPRFAELIIQECADIADMNTHQWDLPGKYIIQHFGVEE